MALLKIAPTLVLWLLVAWANAHHGASRSISELATRGDAGHAQVAPAPDHASRWLTESNSAEVVVNSVNSLWAALANDGIRTILLNDSLVLNQAPPNGTIPLTRNVSIQAVPELLSAGIKVFVDFRSQVRHVLRGAAGLLPVPSGRPALYASASMLTSPLHLLASNLPVPYRTWSSASDRGTSCGSWGSRWVRRTGAPMHVATYAPCACV